VQAEILGTAASVVSLIGAAVTIIQQIETAQRNIKGASKTFDDVSGQLDDVCQSLYFVKKEPRLQTSMIGSQIRIIIKVAEDLKTFLEKLHVKRRMKFFPGLVHALKSGEEESKQLVELLSKLDRARAELVLRISVTHIALTGDLKSDMSLVNNGILEMTSKVDYLSRGEHTSTDLNLGMHR
jgi:seryl-tRNA synthetase